MKKKDIYPRTMLLAVGKYRFSRLEADCCSSDTISSN